jgi:O-acetyl-ADP-ribose deacetylase (regulator of RNase III)
VGSGTGAGVRPVLVDGDLLAQDVDVIVNAWNRNIIPWWMLVPQGVSGAIKRRAGHAPFRELSTLGPIPLGGAVLTGAGRLPYRAIIHVAGINMLWRASERSVRGSVRSAMGIVQRHGFSSVAFPIIGAGSGGLSAAHALSYMLDELGTVAWEGRVVVVRFAKPQSSTVRAAGGPTSR